MKKVLLIMLLAIMVMVIFIPVAFAATPMDKHPALLDEEDTSAEVVATVDEPPDVWGDYILGQAYILIPALYVIGIFIKKTPKIPDWVIPIVLLVLGIIGGGFLVGWTVTGIIQGVLVAGVTVYGNQAYKQIGNGVNGTG